MTYVSATPYQRKDKMVREYVIRLRNQRGWSSNELAQEAGIDQSLLSKIDRGERRITLENASRIAMALGIPFGEIHALWTFEEQPVEGREVLAQYLAVQAYREKQTLLDISKSRGVTAFDIDIASEASHSINRVFSVIPDEDRLNIALRIGQIWVELGGAETMQAPVTMATDDQISSRRAARQAEDSEKRDRETQRRAHRTSKQPPKRIAAHFGSNPQEDHVEHDQVDTDFSEG